MTAEPIQGPDGEGAPQQPLAEVGRPAVGEVVDVVGAAAAAPRRTAVAPHRTAVAPEGGPPGPAAVTGAVASVWSDIFSTAYRRLRDWRRSGSAPGGWVDDDAAVRP
ncbi:hypothetical protein ACFV5G_10890 [Streptomyces sp. NPDC059766]|uniref:hypothetical protein n=1 Tax=Streptomyces sp. NPDC059766 TaxID=3346940 RepID=UPI00365FE0D5